MLVLAHSTINNEKSDTQDAVITEIITNKYSEDIERRRRRAIRRGIWVAVLIYLLFSFSDYIMIPDVAETTVFARFVIGATTLIAIELQFRSGAHISNLDRICAASLVVGYAGWLIPAIQTSHTINMSYYMIFGAIFMMGANLFFTFSFGLSIFASSAVLGIYFIGLSQSSYNYYYLFCYGTFFISCFAFTSYVNWRLNRERHNVNINAIEAKIQQHEADERGQQLIRLSNTDPLTNVDNRRAIDQRLLELWDDWNEFDINFAVFLIDVDFFKKYNDYYGHSRGDKCLIEVSKAMAGALRPLNASFGRYGGEEFIALARYRSQEQLEVIAEIIRRSVENLALPHEQRRDGNSKITVSVGVTYTRPNVTLKLERLINEADRALYQAKGNGRNRFKIFNPDDPFDGDAVENVAALLNIGIKKKLVSLVYQPIKNLSTDKIIGAEALMRLQQLDGTSIPPNVFIPIAERTGIISELGLWVIKTVCDEMLQDARIPLVSVNVSPLQLKNPSFAASVAVILDKTGITGNRLAFELTEGHEMEMNSDILVCISHLKQLGIKIWLDDFGTGFAGLSWLRLIDFDTVKIDRSFLNDSSSPRGKLMLNDIITLIRNRNHHILTEGVECAAQLELLKECNIDYAQGYHLGRPVQADVFKNNMFQDAA